MNDEAGTPTGLTLVKPEAATSEPVNPLDDYGTQRALARLLKVSPTHAGRIAAELNLPFIVLRKRKLFRLSAVAECLRAQETTLDVVRRKARR